MSKQPSQNQQSTANPGAIQSVTQALVFPAGIYRFNVQTAAPIVATQLNVPFPALLVAAGPGLAPGMVEFVGKPSAVSAWLFNTGDSVVVKVAAAHASIVISSLRTAETSTTPFDIKVEQIDARPAGNVAQPSSQAPSLKLKIGVHVHGQKVIQQTATDWAGRAGSGAYIEAITIKPQEIISPDELEYKSLSANGFETPWLSNGAVCGTKGANLPLVGFAARLKPQAAAQYECEYSIAFRSGAVVGPVRNGVPARSKTAGDAIEAIQVRVVKRDKPAAAPTTSTAPKMEAKATSTKTVAKKSPKFGAFREEEAPAPKSAAKATKPTKTKSAIAKKLAQPAKTATPSKPAKKVIAKKSAPSKRK